MARMYSRKKGKSRSKKPLEIKKHSWITYSPKEVEMLIAKLAKEGKKPSQIGLMLRDIYGIPDVRSITKKTITQILKEKNLAGEIPEDLLMLIKKAILIKKHTEKNKHDKTAKRGLQLTESKINRLVRYYKKKGRLPKDWKYNIDKATLYLH